MPANLSGAVKLWEWIMNVGDNGRRDPTVGPNPYRVNPDYTKALFHMRVIDRPEGLLTVQRVSILGSLNSNGFVPVNFAAAEFHTVAQWRGNFLEGDGQIRYCKGTDATAGPLSRRTQTLIPPFLMLEWTVSPVGDAGMSSTAQIWATFLGPEAQATN